ncbi:single-stranded DNA-binding protein [Burkholderia cenocepacia]|uniref:single-stranded DNA-binding protein n=1 Tax=Burkholderia cenocepacia TaxID=95486 RepID=UPI002ABD5D8A|nr:single-stranded DNA-binding protein [Burkholderia cenocepacia]
MSVRRFEFIGNLTRDADLQYIGDAQDRALATVDIAVNDSWKGGESGEKHESTDYFRIKAWGKTAENAGKYLGKGSQIYVAGRIQNTKYEKNGETIYGNDFVAEQIDYLRTKPPGGQGSAE